MQVRPSPELTPADAAQGGQVLSIVVVEPEGQSEPLAGLVTGRVDLVSSPVSSLEALFDLVASGTIDAVVVDPELAEGWPAEIALEVAERLGERVAVVMVCRSKQDATLIEGRIRHVPVLVRERLDAEGLVAVLKGELAMRRAN